jgi:acetyl-CoA carboxylase carboxyl transferase subunit beta
LPAARDPADRARDAARGFPRSEFLLDHGAIDMILDRRDLRERIASLLRILLRRPAPSG